MAKNKLKNKANELNLVGQKIGDSICESFLEIGDAILIMYDSGKKQLYTRSSLSKKPAIYKLEGKEVIQVIPLDNHALFIFETSEKRHFVDDKNQKINGSDEWTDYYIEPHTSSFFRKDIRGRWYDIQGYLLKTPFLIKDQVLCSLNGKKSKNALFFRNQKMYVNPKHTMVQVGKMVYDIQLNLINFFGERVTGLGPKNIVFENNDSVQEIRLGLSKTAFINEYSYKPFLIKGEEMRSHIASRKIGGFSFEVFESDTDQYTVINAPDNCIQYNDKPLNVKFDTYQQIGTFQVIKVLNHDEEFYWDLDSNQPFDPMGTKDKILEIYNHPIQKNSANLFNFKSESGEVVYNPVEKRPFKIKNAESAPQRIEAVSGFEKYFYYAILNGKRILCNIKTDEIIKVGPNEIEISEIIDENEHKLINIITRDEKHKVLDARFGMNKLKIANIGSFDIVRTTSDSKVVGNFRLQNVLIDTLGGPEERTINISQETLFVFHLPNDLKAYSEQSDLSVFAGNEITSVDFSSETVIENKAFYKAKFIDYINEQKNVMIQKENGRPLQLDGVGHRNELVQSFDPTTLTKKYYLSDHRIIGVNTLTEDLKEGQLLFSFKIMSSWLPFYDTYLPILKRIKDFEGFQEWEYHLFELHNLSKQKEYIAVEQNKPFRILADKRKTKYRPRIVKSNEIILKSPEEISAIRRFFSNPGILVEVG